LLRASLRDDRLLGRARFDAAQSGADLGWVAGEVLADDVQTELVQDRGGGLAFEKKLERRPDQFLGGDVAAAEGWQDIQRGTLTWWLVPAGVWTRKVPSAWRVTVTCAMPSH